MKCSMTNLLEYGSDCFINLKPEIRTVGVDNGAFEVFCYCKSCNKFFFGLNKVIEGFFELTRKI